MTIYIFHHNDMDGICAGIIAKNAIKNETNEKIKTIECDYDSTILFKDVIKKFKIKNDDKVIVVDFYLQKDNTSKLYDLLKDNFIWIDHHDTSIKDIGNLNIKGLRSTENSATYLAWKFFFKEKDTPDIVYYTDIFDTWKKSFIGDKSWNDFIIPFMLGMEATDIKINNKIIQDLLFSENKDECTDKIINIVKNGKIIQQYKSIINKKDIESHMFEATFDNRYKIICINKFGSGSSSLDCAFDENKYDFMLTFSINKNKKVSVGLYSNSENPKVHVGKLAKEFGGGGHPGAAGIEFDDINKFMSLLS